MKKIDFHIHTKATNIDNYKDINFDLKILSMYIDTMSIDAIAITNHNEFDFDQYEDIKRELSSVKVFPGIEVSLERGHILVIAPDDQIIKFKEECELVKQKFIVEVINCLTIDEFLKIFTDIGRYLLIPHYDKKPKPDEIVFRKLEDFIYCGEVSSPKKFEYCIKSEKKITPVLFSDFRNYSYNPDPKEGKTFPNRQTYLDCNELSLPAIKLALMDKKNVSLVNKKINDNFEILPDGTYASTGINLIVGERSSGKTHTLDYISNSYDTTTVNYIKQFSLVSKNEDKTFNEIINKQNSQFNEPFLQEIKVVVDKMSKIDNRQLNNELDDYISTLQDYAYNQNKQDIYSKNNLFTATTIPSKDDKTLKNLISALVTLLDSFDNDDYKGTIQKFLNKDNLIELLNELLVKYKKIKLFNYAVDETTKLVKSIQEQLERKSAITRPRDFDVLSYLYGILAIKRFNKLINSIKKDSKFLEQDVQGTFKIVGQFSKMTNVTDVRKVVDKSSQINKDSYEKCDSPYQVLLFLLTDGVLTNKEDAYKCFIKLEYEIINKYGMKLSGGEKAEFNLLKKLQDASKYDLTLIDELESSFDNWFLNKNIIDLIRDISKKSTVFISTHNNNLGVLLKPQRILYTKRYISNGKSLYKIYSGDYTDKYLVNSGDSDDKISNFDVIIHTMEAGEEAYDERQTIYKNFKDR